MNIFGVNTAVATCILLDTMRTAYAEMQSMVTMKDHFASTFDGLEPPSSAALIPSMPTDRGYRLQ